MRGPCAVLCRTARPGPSTRSRRAIPKMSRIRFGVLRLLYDMRAWSRLSPRMPTMRGTISPRRHASGIVVLYRDVYRANTV